MLELSAERLHHATARKYLLRTYTAAFAFSWLPQHDPAFGGIFFFIWSTENLGGPPDAGRKCLFAVVPYGVRDLLRAGGVPAMLAAGYCAYLQGTLLHIVGLLRYFGAFVSLSLLVLVYRQGQVGYA